MGVNVLFYHPSVRFFQKEVHTHVNFSLTSMSTFCIKVDSNVNLKLQEAIMKIDDRAIGMFENDLFSLQMIGDFFGATRQGVKKFLNLRGVDTSKRKYKIVCDECGTEFEKTKSYIRNRRKNYCKPKCYYTAIHNPNYNQNRQGQRMWRGNIKVTNKVIETVADIPKDFVSFSKAEQLGKKVKK